MTAGDRYRIARDYERQRLLSVLGRRIYELRRVERMENAIDDCLTLCWMAYLGNCSERWALQQIRQKLGNARRTYLRRPRR